MIKKIILLLSLVLSLLADDIVVFTNEYNILKLDKRVKKLIVGNKEMINVSLLKTSKQKGTLLKIFGKQSGNTSILVIYKDETIHNYHVYVNENLGFIQKMINVIEPKLVLSKVGNGSTVISGEFEDPHDKKRIYILLENAGIDMTKLMDLTETKKVNKMIRTKLYLVEINNQKAKDLGGVTGMGFFNEYLNLAVNPGAVNGATFSGWLLDNTGLFTHQKGTSVTGTLNFLEEAGVGTVLDDTVLMTTEDENASFRVGGEVYIPIGMTQNLGVAPTIQLEEREYGLRLILSTQFMEKEDFMHISIDIKDSEFDTNKDHDVQLGADIFVPSFISKNMTTNVVVKSGQVIALGGRLHSEEIDKEEKVPFLGDIPFIGELFKHTVTSTKSNDLLFFLVPEIIDANEKIDDTHFYRDLKNASAKFHKESQDMNVTKLEQDLDPIKATITEKIEPESDELMIIELEEETITSTHDKSQEIMVEESLNPTYRVSTGKIFLRSAPVDGSKILVWKEGHRFKIEREREIDGVKWLKIKEDCFIDCTRVSQELWISKRFTSII